MTALRLFAASLLGFLAAHAADTPADPALPAGFPADKTKVRVFLLMGQSNMAGYGCVAKSDPWGPDDKKPVPGVYVLDGQSTPSDPKPVTPVAWRPGAHRLHLNQGTAQFGLGMDFAKTYLASHPDMTVALIPCAWGGAGIGSLNKGTAGYGNAVMRARLAAKVGVISGVLWHQGESDTVNAKLSAAYAGKLDRLVADLRADLGAPALPFVAGDLADFYGTGPDHAKNAAHVAGIKVVRKTLAELPTRVPGTAFVPSEGLKSIDKHMVHLDRASLITFGQRYAEALTALEKRAPETPAR